jgi:hypothetical protein
VVLAANPLRFALTADAEVPEPIDCEVVDEYVDSVLDVPHSNHAVVDAPFGFTLPFTVPEFDVTELEAEVVAVGMDWVDPPPIV